MLDWLRYSGASITVTMNPCHWRLVPRARQVAMDEWVGPHERSYFASWLFVTVRVWIDDGSW